MNRRRKQAEAHPENHERWIVSYADMLTLLFAVFVVLYAMGETNADKLARVRTSIDRAFDVGVLTSSDGASPIFDGGGGISPSIDEVRMTDLASISAGLRRFTSDPTIGSRVQVRSDGDSISITLAEDLLFGSGSAALRPGSQEVLTTLAGILAPMPNALRVEGHTDNVPVNNPDFPTNWELSSARANAVLRFLESAGLAADRLSSASYADTRPLGDNATPEGRALNRRADIVVLYPSEEPGDLTDPVTPGVTP